MKRIKIWLFRLLMNEVCDKSTCQECCCFKQVKCPLDECAVSTVLRQARKIWED